MSKHTHEWLTQYFVFPGDDGDYEHDEPYEVQYCGDRECGQRQTLLMSDELIELTREFNGYPAETIEKEVNEDEV